MTTTAQPMSTGGELLARLGALLDQRRAGAARPLLNALLRLLPETDDLAILHARVLLLEADAPAACGVLDAALDRAPGSAKLLLARAVMRGHCGDLAAAAADAAEAVLAEPESPLAKATLGASLHRLGRYQEARACLAEAVAAAPAEPGYRVQLASAEAACGDEQAALATLEQGLAANPADLGLRTAAIEARLRCGDAAGAEALAAAARRAGIADAAVLGLLGQARFRLGRHADAAEAYAEARQLSPEDPWLGQLAAASAGLPVAPTRPPA